VVERIRKGARRTVHLGIVIAIASAVAIAGAARGATGAAASSQAAYASVTSTALALAAPVVGVSATPTGRGYWRVARDGGVLTAGDAGFYGAATRYAHAGIVAMAPTPTGRGYWLVDRAGAVFSFGDARFRGSMGGRRLDQPIVGMAATRDGNGYWLVASDGGIFAFNAPFRGSMGGRHLDQPVVGMAATPAGSGYTLVASDGGLFNFGSVAFYGSAYGACRGAPAVGVTMSTGAVGYWISFADGRTYAFSPATKPPTCAPSDATRAGQLASDLFTRANQERALQGLAALAWDPTLAGHASRWSADMAARGFRHSDIGALLGPYNFVGENIAMGGRGVTVGSLHNAWMNSPGHRSNILAVGYTHIGVGVYCGADGSVWLTEVFGRPTAAGSPPPPASPWDGRIARPDAGSLTC
jgi:uncharacterized protein YkwD